MLTFSNPRLHAEFNDWPSGGQRVHCVFAVETDPRKGYRVSRTTTGKPKRTTWSGRAAIVDGDDGRTYILQIAAAYGFITISRSDFMNAENSHVSQDDPRFAALTELIRQANA